MAAYAWVKDGIVVNLSEWDGIKPVTVPEGYTRVQSDIAQIGWLYSGGEFSPPATPEPVPEVPSSLYNETKNAAGYRPLDVLFYYGYPNSFNSATNGWYNEKVAQDMARYEMIVLGAGVQDPNHADYANTQVIIPRVQEINKDAKFYGYVICPDTLSTFKTKCDQWNTLGAKGIFIDECGYDFSNTRAQQNERIDYIHSLSVSNTCFVNAWNTDHVIGIANDVTYPNTTYNPSLIDSHLTSSDWVLVESFPINTSAYSGNNGYESGSDWTSRGQKVQNLRNNHLVNFCGLGIINNDNINGNSLFTFGYISAFMWSLDSYGTSDIYYGASSAQVNWWDRIDVTGLKEMFDVNAVVVNDALDSDIYFRYVRGGKFVLDFSADAQSSSITKR
jgi:hypothetical protein